MRAVIKMFHRDSGGEFTSNEFREFLEMNGIAHQVTVHDTPEENGVAERLNRTLMERVRAP